jgi:hypothetical protein
LSEADLRLKQFELAAPSLPKEANSEFRYQTRCVTALFERHFGGLVTQGVWKVWIDCVPKQTRDKVTVIGGVAEAEVVVSEDLSQFASLPELEKRQRALQYLMRGLECVSKEYHWSTAPFEEARGKVIELKYENTWVLKKRQRGSHLEGELSCIHDSARFQATLIIRDRKGLVLSSKRVLDTKPDELHFGQKIGELKWVDNNLKLLDKFGKETGSISAT